MKSLKEIKELILKGDLKKLFSKDSKEKFHPSEIAELLNAVSLNEAWNIFDSFIPERQVTVFPFVGAYLQKQLIKKASDEQKRQILNHLTSNDRYAFLTSLKGIQRSSLLNFLDEENRKVTEKMLGYSPQSVGRLLNTQFVTLRREMTIEQAMEYLRINQPDTDAADVIYVTDEGGKLIDDIPIRRLVLNGQQKTIGEIMDHAYVCLQVNEHIGEAIAKFEQYDRSVLPVVTEENLLLGVVTIDDILDATQQRDTREMQRFGGLESLEYPYVKTSVFSLIKKRAGWLIILFVGEMFTATAMGFFEKEIAKAVVLALFVPLVISSGGNSGSQAATLIIRALSVGELTIKNWFYVLRRELLSGLSLGIILGAIGFLRITAWEKLGWYDYGPHWLLMAVTIFFSLIGIVMWGTISGSMIPIVLKKLKQDPATSSAPFVATLVDVTGLVIYFSIAAIVLRGTILK
ncbi:MAG: magnesium transporter [Bacteroidota bacterium]|nr:magnesium transporter [Bacteroidota bacterium]